MNFFLEYAAPDSKKQQELPQQLKAKIDQLRQIGGANTLK